MASKAVASFRSGWLAIGCLLAFAVSAAEPTSPVVRAQAVSLLLPGKPALTLEASALAAMPHTGIRAAAHDESPSDWRGVALRDILLRAGVPLDKPLRGKALANFVRVTATDHYQVVFGLADLDPSLGNTQVILADQKDGKPLAEDGPFRLVVGGDQRPARWVRSVAAIEIVDGSSTDQP
ncbi:molybdopterin-dependent oxidoreductase [Dyella halodurans]|uniref:Molybdopterin-dependent oxidoreductase n=1 Tax=Dyella halodurans TaxID=1920171 RepID=A0ABV9C3Y7_9GAMM|nr:molybdopterin-dependent oxidoreductase [Dyella halodurans]